MKKLLGILVFSLLLSLSAKADDVKEFPEDITVNDLTQNGYKLINVETVSIKNNQELIYGTYYHLIKKGDLVSCFLLQGDVTCYRP